ncbi:vesicular glutamate transporter 2-like isoform X2 [Phlebotomus papatasi]|uniref:vesicular glutamate transporter 2-like isoform X2 n=1 Tax=Phlebotomus papatasi TaxID=29031 RepID=UPI0024844DE2|nr:vesicular glutamate transporter 2-like isoform X2 [Phlebotomus papatasi]
MKSKLPKAKEQFNWKIWKFRRYIVTVMSMLGFFNTYTTNLSMSVAIVAMTQKVNVILVNGTIVEKQEFDWNSKEQGLILSSVFYGCIWTQFIGGILAARFGGHVLFGVGVGVGSILMLVSPLAAKQGVIPLVITRILLGLFDGLVFPSIQDVYAHWVPIYERTTITGIVHSGCAIGTFTSFLVSGLLAQYLGWESIFYLFGGIGCVWFIIWMIYIKRDPASDPRISPEERAYIECNLENLSDKKDLRTPWKAIFSSSAVIAITVVNFCDTWCSIIFQAEIPTFLNDVLKYDLGQTGIIAAAPYLIYIITVYLVSPLSDFIRSRNILTTQQVRKIFIASGFLVTACLLSLVPNLNSATAVSTSLIIAIGLTAVTRVTYYSNILDFAPNYASVIMGISFTIAVIPGVVGPSIVGFLVQNGSKDEWKIVFYIAAGFCALGATVFGIFGKGKVQTWAQCSETQDRRIDRAIN